MRERSRITSFDIAHRAGVSQSTVSRALRGSSQVNEETRQRVLRAVAELNYKVDKNASNLRRKHAGTLALLLSEDPTADESHINPFFLSMLGAITRACAQHDYDLLVSFQQFSPDWHADYAEAHKADGIILLGYGDYLSYCDKLRRLAERGTRAVRWGAVLPGQGDVSIGCDNHAGGRLVTEHLLAQGCRRIAFLGDASSHYPEFFARYLGYAETLEQAGITVDPALQVDAVSTESAGQAALATLLARGVAFDAVFAASDLIAIGALHALGAHGLRVPADVALAGFDDIALAGFVNPPLTSVLQDTQQAGRILVESLLRLIRGEPVESTLLPVTLKVRRSSLRREAG
ncbi:MAG: LacI family DNA-binding transcriptional regulator [Fulvimonas sp.]|nr:LacI family DNA-binding transcriptional regulator [Fulvimonas sp.]